MKTRVFSIAAVAFLLLAFVSCKKDNAEGEIGLSLGYSDADYFAGQFVSLDEAGNVALRLSGCLLNEADDTEISYCTEEWQDALSMFKDWLPEGAVYTETESSLTWKMRDAGGKSLGNAVLSKKSGNLVAEAVLPAGTPYVRTIRFIPKAAWPENAVSMVAVNPLEVIDLLEDYYVGNTINISSFDVPDGHDHGTGEFLVLREFDVTNQEKGIIFRLQPGLWDAKRAAGDNGIFKRRRNMSDAKLVSKLYRQKKDFLEPIIQEMESFGPRTAWYYAYEPHPGFWDNSHQKIQMHTGSIHNWNGIYPNANELSIYYFWVEQNNSGHAVFKME